MALIKPPPLKPGDTIGIVAPASNIRAELLRAGIRELERLGLRAKYLPTIFEKDLYTAGSDDRRANEVMTMMCDPEVRAIFAARGGYGSARILDRLDPDMMGRHPRIVMGYSDITTLLLWLQKKLGWVVFHGPMVTREFAAGAGHYDEELFWRVLGRTRPIGPVDTQGTRILSPGRAQGRLVGGCLTLLTNSLATDYELDTTDAILFIEDYHTRPYQIDRMLTHLKQAGKLTSVRGLLFGEMTGCVQHENQSYTMEDVIMACVGDLNVPILFGLRSGHSDHGNLVLPLGVTATLDCTSQPPSLIVEESAVE
jgi:muramoyltetrapeptide carboxypeptidase